MKLVHDFNLVDQLDGLPKTTFSNEVYRATRLSLDPLAFSTNGGRWAPRGKVAVLYTSLQRDGALAEVVYYWTQLTPIRNIPMALHRIQLKLDQSLRLIKTDLPTLGIALDDYNSTNYKRTQEVGAAVNFLGCDGLIVPSARWKGENLVIFSDNFNLANPLEVVETENGVQWQAWARENGFLDEE